MVLVDGEEHLKGIGGNHKPSPCPPRHLSRGHAHHQPRGPDHSACKSAFQMMWAKFCSHLMQSSLSGNQIPAHQPSICFCWRNQPRKTWLLGLTFCTKPNSPESTSSVVESSEVWSNCLPPLPPLPDTCQDLPSLARKQSSHMATKNLPSGDSMLSLPNN